MRSLICSIPFLLFCTGLRAQQPTQRAPDCVIPFQFSGTSGTSPSFDNRYQGCNVWTLEYSATNASTVSIGMEFALDNGNTPGTFSAFGSVLSSSQFAAVTVPGYVPWINVTGSFTYNSAPPSGQIRGTVVGWRPGPDESSGGGGSNANNCATNYGADPSGQVDSTTALQTCINSLAPGAVNDGATVYIPPSGSPNYFYLCTGVLTWGPSTNPVIHGRIILETGANLQGCSLPAPTPSTWITDYTSSDIVGYGALYLPNVTQFMSQQFTYCTAGAPSCEPIWAAAAGVLAFGSTGTELNTTTNSWSGNMPGTPAWLRWLGTGAEGTYSCASGICNLNMEHWYSGFTVASGAIVAVNTVAQPNLIIRSTGTCTIAGSVSASVNTGSGSGNSGAGDFGGTGGGGGGGTAAGATGGNDTLYGGHSPIAGGTAGGATGGTPGAGNAPPANYTKTLVSSPAWFFGGAQGGTGGSTGGTGGLGGGVIIFACQSIVFSGTIDVSGGNGGAGGSNSGGGGGGGGGYAILAGVTVTNSGTLTVTGGSGGLVGTGNSAAGGAGGAGWSQVLTIQ